MKRYWHIVEYVITVLVLTYFLYKDYEEQTQLKIPRQPKIKRVTRENLSTDFDYPPLPGPYKSKILQKPDYGIPLILIGGNPRSGTTLMRSMLDAHEMVRCGEETHIIPTVAMDWDSDRIGNDTLKEYARVGLTQDVLDRAVANFLLVVIIEHGHQAWRFCNKDPMTMLNAVYINKLFPESKFIFMVRDGRAVVHSAITRNVGIGSFDLRSYEQSMRAWNNFVHRMYVQCEKLGTKFCLPVFYEELILQPRKVMKEVLRFLELPWRGEVLKHEQFVDREGGIKLNPKEPSTNQVSKARYEDALTSWVGKIPAHILPDMDRIAPMLSVLGYDPLANPPPYHRLQYRWGQKLTESSVDRTPYRWFVSALYHKTNDTEVKTKREK